MKSRPAESSRKTPATVIILPMQAKLLHLVFLSVALLTTHIAAATPDFWENRSYSISLRLEKVDPSTGVYSPKPAGALAFPAYTEEYISHLLFEYVIVDFTVSATGKVSDIKTISALDEATDLEVKRAVAKWAFLPAREIRGNKAVPMRLRCRFDFRYEEPKVAPLQDNTGASNRRKDP